MVDGGVSCADCHLANEDLFAEIPIRGHVVAGIRLRAALPLAGMKIVMPANGRPYEDCPASTGIRVTK